MDSQRTPRTAAGRDMMESFGLLSDVIYRGDPLMVGLLRERVTAIEDQAEAAALDVERLARAIEAAWDSPIHPPIRQVPADQGKAEGDVRWLSPGESGWFQLRPTPGLAARIVAAYARLAVLEGARDAS